MSNNKKKILFLVITLFLGIYVQHSKFNKNEKHTHLISSWYTDAQLSVYDTAEVLYASDAQLLVNLYDGLVTYDKNLRIDNFFAKKIKWIQPDTFEFFIKDGLKSSKGDNITSEDVFLTFKRLIILNKNTHGSLRNFLCNTSGSHFDFDKDCNGLSYTRESVLLKVTNPKYIKFVLDMLTSVDFLIIPKNAIDWNDSNLKIVDYGNTSGAYFVKEQNMKKEIVLELNPYSPHFNLKIPKKILLVPYLNSKSTEDIKSNRIDMITSIDRASIKDKLSLSTDFEVFRTKPIRGINLFFTDKGISQFSIETRLAISKIIKNKILQSNKYGDDFETDDQFFPKMSDGSLTTTQLEQYKKLLLNVDEHNLISNKKKLMEFKLTVPKAEVIDYQKIFEDIAFIKIEPFSGMPHNKVFSKQEDAFILPVDTSFHEDISLISHYTTSTKYFGLNKQEGESWLLEYMSIEDKDNRLNLLRSLHLNFLLKGNVFPIGKLPYVTVVSKNYKLNLSQYLAISPFWAIEEAE